MKIEAPMKTLQAINEKLESKKEPLREYMGISYLGHKCERNVWLNFRWAKHQQNNGRMLRLLRRGQREEEEIISLLQSVGVEVTEYGDNQREIVLTSWVKGHSDGIILSGLKESNKPHILEMKTSNDKAFKELQNKGVKEAKPMHYTQMQLYMLGSKIDRAFYYCVNKNDDEVYTERNRLDKEFAEKARDRGDALAEEGTMPPGLSTSPTWYECKLCQFWGICHNKETVNKTCRTCEKCKFSDGKVYCLSQGKELSAEQQENACDNYELHYDLRNLCQNN